MPLQSLQSKSMTIKSIVICLSMIIFLHWSFNVKQVESSPVLSQQQQSTNNNWETEQLPLQTSKLSSNNNNQQMNELSDRLYRLIYKRLSTDSALDDMDFDDGDRFNRQERHLRFGKRFNQRSKYSDIDYGHMRFGRR